MERISDGRGVSPFEATVTMDILRPRSRYQQREEPSAWENTHSGPLRPPQKYRNSRKFYPRPIHACLSLLDPPYSHGALKLHALPSPPLRSRYVSPHHPVLYDPPDAKSPGRTSTGSASRSQRVRTLGVLLTSALGVGTCRSFRIGIWMCGLSAEFCGTVERRRRERTGIRHGTTDAGRPGRGGAGTRHYAARRKAAGRRQFLRLVGVPPSVALTVMRCVREALLVRHGEAAGRFGPPLFSAFAHIRYPSRASVANPSPHRLQSSPPSPAARSQAGHTPAAAPLPCYSLPLPVPSNPPHTRVPSPPSRPSPPTVIHFPLPARPPSRAAPLPLRRLNRVQARRYEGYAARCAGGGELEKKWTAARLPRAHRLPAVSSECGWGGGEMRSAR
ncbi:hypothetical protein B0H11DRAFT_1378790 [Mycena galericulata]|nr:hypothetical protein B0H11DRAFT_1378790 [Mycena galericulata]